MKKTVTSVMAIVLLLSLALGLCSCEPKVEEASIWDSATYTEDVTLGSGSKTVQVEVKVNEKSITFTIRTDAATLGAALLEHNLIEGEQGDYGLYIKKVNGIVADYDVNQRYWGFYKDGAYLMTGVDTTEISDGEHYEIVYSK